MNTPWTRIPALGTIAAAAALTVLVGCDDSEGEG